MNQSFVQTSPYISNYAEIGDQVRVWLVSEGETVRPQIVEGTLREIRQYGAALWNTAAPITSIVVVTAKGEYRDLDRSIIGSIERVE